jgi:hypothetical protein
MTAERYDVVVAGGGAAGVAAAIGAARAGARTLLLERYGFLGGAATNAGVLTYCGLFLQREAAVPAVAGVASEVLRRLAGLGADVAPIRGRSGNWIVLFEPEPLKLALDEAVAAAGAEAWLHARVTGADVVSGRLRGVQVTDHAGTRLIEATSFVDASGEATLSALAGLPAAVDRGDPVQAASLPIRLGGIAPAVELDRSRFAAAAAAVNAGRKGPCLRGDGGVIIRLPGAGEVWWTCIDIATDGLSAADLSAAERVARRLAWDAVQALRRQPGFAGAYIIATGPQLGVRETRRPRARCTLTRAHGLEGRRAPDGIARAAWPMEVHAAPGRPVFTPIGGEGFFDVPLDALRPQGCDNLFLGGRVIGADADAYGSVRVMGTGFATGQAAGAAAACAAAAGAVDIDRLRAVLAAQGAIL